MPKIYEKGKAQQVTNKTLKAQLEENEQIGAGNSIVETTNVYK